MSRSRRHFPAGPIAVCQSNKKFKQIENRKKRRKESTVLLLDEEVIEDKMPDEKKFGNEWCSPRDGKCCYPTEMELRKSLDATLKAELNKGIGREQYAYCLWNNFYDPHLLDDFKQYLRANSKVLDIKNIDPYDLNKFIKAKAKKVLRK